LEKNIQVPQLPMEARGSKKNDNYSLSADFLANSSHIMAGISPV